MRIDDHVAGALGYPDAELVFGLVYPTGTDYTGVQLTLENYIKRFKYKPNAIWVSDFISKILKKVNIGVVVDDKSEASHINTLMTAGNSLCELAKDPSFLVAGIVSEINHERGSTELPSGQEPLPRTAHIILSLKRPAEVELLRGIYGSGFYLVGIFASEKDRLQYLTVDKNIPKVEAQHLMQRDEDVSAPQSSSPRVTRNPQ